MLRTETDRPRVALSAPARPSLLSLVLVALLGTSAAAQQPGPPPGMPPIPPPAMPRGLVEKAPGVAPGYVLFGTALSGDTYLVDNDGRVVHVWKSRYAGGGGYLLPNGNLLRTGRDPNALTFRAGGVNGILQELAWDGRVVWEWKLSTEERVLHHDIEPLPNGNLLAIGWEVKTPERALAAGRRPGTVPEKGLHADFVIEVEPVRPAGANVVWSWHVWDHLVQDVDPALPNHGDPAAHPGRLDINALTAAAVSPEELEQLKALGYVPADAEQTDLDADFLHVNAVDYHAGLDQLVLTVPELGEIWILDHSTTTEQAAGSAGGRAGRGGEILYRWGNPAVYGRGDESDQRLFYQHDARWIPDGHVGAGQLMIFDNGRERPGPPFSRVLQIELPVRPDGTYTLADGEPFGPSGPSWQWALAPELFAPFISGAARLPNGNTLACSGPGGTFVESDPTGRIVWTYRNPFSGNVRLADGSPPQPSIDRFPFGVFRVTRIPPDHPGLAGRKLAPLDPQPAWHVTGEES